VAIGQILKKMVILLLKNKKSAKKLRRFFPLNRSVQYTFKKKKKWIRKGF